ncbi:MAG: DUF4869 domain-containing protein [Lachnospiraceae bacterium]|nr:DUF4869 domain-containing protein [Lachnospiraceae bacterium]
MLYITLYSVKSFNRIVTPDYKWESDLYFDAIDFEPFMLDPFTVKLIKEVDDSDVVAPNLIQSPYLGAMSPTELSSGCKTVLCMKFFHDFRFDLGRMGENCYPFLLEAAKDTDIHIFSDDNPMFTETGDYCVVENTDEKVLVGRDLRNVARRLLSEGKI